jgi:hypothetical protein
MRDFQNRLFLELMLLTFTFVLWTCYGPIHFPTCP